MSSDSDETGDTQVRRTTDPTVVRGVVEERGGYPAHESKTEGQGDRGLLALGRHGREEGLKEITWDEFADEFEEKALEFVYPEDPSDPDAVDGEAGVGEIDAVGELRERPDR